MSGMFRIYKCPSCGAIAYIKVENEQETSTCGLCRGPILDEPGILYSATINQAEDLVAEMVLRNMLENKVSAPTSGLGVRRRVLSIIACLVELNRGRSVSIEDVLQECVGAKIKTERGLHFLDVLEGQGLVIIDGGHVSLGEGGVDP
ncbi:MAG: hypothetical protein KAU89_01350 [Candidatus Thorarchaeota archaeon]|jgi:superfamily II helicase|nr:hypothetical protein [Candidatus Thorarchaeota archaeon]